jgi:hypothetical protein
VAVNFIVLVVTLLMVAYLAVWIFFPRLRAWMEMPKYRFLERQRKFLGVVRGPQLTREEVSQQQPRRD